MMERVYLSRTNLLSLLSKLDRQANGADTFCTIIKRDDRHPKYPQSVPEIAITALEDAEYYTDRPAGEVYHEDTTPTN